MNYKTDTISSEYRLVTINAILDGRVATGRSIEVTGMVKTDIDLDTRCREFDKLQLELGYQGILSSGNEKLPFYIPLHDAGVRLKNADLVREAYEKKLKGASEERVTVTLYGELESGTRQHLGGSAYIVKVERIVVNRQE